MADHNPGPLDGSVLYNQENHISEQIWKGKERGPLRAIPVNSKDDTWELNENQWELIRQTGQIVSSSGGSGAAYILELFRKFEKYAWGSACLANLYRNLAKITTVSKAGKPIRGKKNKGKDEEASSKTLTGPLQLLQIWAYSRIRIGRPIIEPRDWKVKIQFPLCKMWARRLQNHHHLTSILDARAQLDSQNANDFVWTPYNDFKGLSKFVTKTDKGLFTSSTVLIYFWVAERHCTERVMKQFALVQIVPPKFLRPIDRTERATLMPVNYKDKLKKVNDMWNKRMKLIIKGDIDDGSPHSDAYFEWYKPITRLRIGRPQIATIHGDLFNDGVGEYANVAPDCLKSVPEFVTAHIFKFSDNLLSSIDEAAKCQDQSQWEDLMSVMRHKVRGLKAACAVGFEKYTLDDSVHNQPDDERMKKQKLDVRTEEKVHSPPSVNVDHSFLTPKLPQCSTPQRGKASSGPDRFSPISSRYLTSPRIPRLDSPMSPNLISVHEILSTPSLQVPLFPNVKWDPNTDIPSLIIKVKGHMRETRLPPRLADYDCKGSWVRNKDYSLTQIEKDILEIFWNEYHSKDEQLYLLCTVVDPENMRKLLGCSWIDNFAMDFWLESLKEKLPYAHMFATYLSLLYVHPKENESSIQKQFEAPEKIFKYHIREMEILFFPIWNHEHFFLLVGNVDCSRWECYNSMPREEDVTFVESYVLWINDRLSQLGWGDPLLWDIIYMDCPRQMNGDDCGIFVLAYVDHILHKKPMRFTQEDMPYYRAKIVYDCYVRQTGLQLIREANVLKGDQS